MTLTQAINWLQSLSCIDGNNLNHDQWVALEAKTNEATRIVDDFMCKSRMTLVEIQDNLWWEK